MNITKTAVVLVLVCAAFFIGWRFLFPPMAEGDGLVNLAECLAEKKVTMYGAEWCSHCQNEKRQIGDAFKYVSYVDCSENTALCVEKGIGGYPTWILGDGTKLIGEQGPEKLARITGCPIPVASE